MESVTPTEQIPETTPTREPWRVERGHNDFDIIEGNRRIAGYIQNKGDADVMAAARLLLAAVKSLLNDIDTGVLVRDITRDGDPNWSREMIAFVQRLQQAQAAVLAAEGR